MKRPEQNSESNRFQ